MTHIDEFLRYLVKEGGSDLHLCTGRNPYIRKHGELVDTKFKTLNEDKLKNLIYAILDEKQIQFLECNRELDIAYMVLDLCRFRINIYKQRGTFAVAIRAISFEVKPFEELGIPTIIKEFVTNMHGLILVTGPQGSGKTTTLAAMIDYINSTRKAHIITIEDPIEYIHRGKRSIVNQREIGKDTVSYKNAMRYILRQDPDVCLIGEIRDTDSIETALALAEAGVLILSTLHSPTAAKTISRIVDMFLPHYQQQVRVQLSLTLKGVITQQLIPNRNGNGRVLACEIMKVTNSIENMIRTYAVKQIHTVIQTGRKQGMQTMDQALFDLYVQKKISKYELSRRVSDKEQLERLLKEANIVNGE